MLAASLYSEGSSHEWGGGGGEPGSGADGWLGRRSPEVEIIWLTANGWLGRRPPGPMPQLDDGLRHRF